MAAEGTAVRSDETGWRRAEWAALVAITLVGLALRLTRPLGGPIWYDEAVTWEASRATWGQLLAWRHHFIHPPLSFMLVKAATSVLGSDASWVLRLPTFVIGVATVPAAFWAGRRAWGGAKAVPVIGGASLALLVAADVGQVHAAGHARMYTLLALSILLTFGLVARWPRRTPAEGDEPRDWLKGAALHGIALGGALAIGVMAHNMALQLVPIVLVVAMAAWWSSPGSRRAIATSAAVGVSIAVFAASPGLFHQINGNTAIPAVVMPEPGDFSLVTQTGERPVLTSFGRIWRSMGVDLFMKDKGVSLALLAFGVGGAALALRRRTAAGVCLAGLLLATALVLPLGLRYHATFSGRYLILAQLACFAGVAAVTALPKSAPPRAIASLLVLVTAAWSAVAAADFRPEPLSIGGAMLQQQRDAIGDSPFATHVPKVRRIAHYYGIADAPPLDEADPAAEVVWLFAAHLRPTDSDAELDAVAAFVAEAATLHGHAIDRASIDAAVREGPASLWRIGSEGVTYWTGSGTDVVEATLTPPELTDVRERRAAGTGS